MADPASPSYASALLRAQGLRPRKRWGQNFLCDRNTLDRIARAAAPRPGERVLEVGAGLGALTRSLADLFAFVTTVEIDPLLAPILAETLAGLDNVRVVYGDFLEMDPKALLDEAFGEAPGVVVGNIPYNITTPILERLLERRARIRTIVLLVQREVADRLTAAPGGKAYGALSVFAQYNARVEKAGTVPPHLFVPTPEVSSTIVRLDLEPGGTVAVPDEAAFFRLVRAAFAMRRKTLLNALAAPAAGLGRAGAEDLLRRAGIDPARRGETLSLEEFARLTATAAA